MVLILLVFLWFFDEILILFPVNILLKKSGFDKPGLYPHRAVENQTSLFLIAQLGYNMFRTVKNTFQLFLISAYAENSSLVHPFTPFDLSITRPFCFMGYLDLIRFFNIFPPAYS